MKNISYKNSIQKKYLSQNKSKSLNSSFEIIIKKILFSFNIFEDAFHTLSKNFIFSFNKKKLYRFKKYKTIVIIGMGDHFGSEAIYDFLKK